MVNSGRPSRGCQTCKSRRIKCDLTRPACQRCLQTGRRCPGVPTESELLFRNQTYLVKAKTQTNVENRGSEPSRSSSEDRSPDPPQLDGANSQETASNSSGLYDEDSMVIVPVTSQSEMVGFRGPPMELAVSFQDVALTFYFRHFVPDPEKEMWMNPILHILRQIFPSAISGSSLYETTAAVAMASLTQFPDMQYMKHSAERKYLTALKVTRDGLIHPNRSKSNDVLISTMLMSLYECMSSSKTAIESYQYHMDGAVALVRHRGSNQLKDPEYLKLFRAVRAHYILDCAHKARSIESPEERGIWRGDALHESNPVNDLYVSSIVIPTLRERANKLLAFGQEPNKDEVLELMREARATDAKLAGWAKTLSAGWIFETIPYSPLDQTPPEEAEIWPGKVHIYFNHLISSVMNNYRCFRIYLQDVIGRCVSWLDSNGQISGNSFLYQATVFVTRQLVDDICASVPFHMGCIPGRAPPKGIPITKRRKAAEAFGSFYLIRPLFVAHCVGCLPNEQRRWLKGRLEYIAGEYRFHRAGVLAQMPPSLLTGRAPLEESES